MKIVLSGSLSIDQIMTFDGLYENLIQADKLHVLSIGPLVQEMRRTQGGVAGNIAYSLALLGESPILYSAIGQADGHDYIASLAKIGVDTSQVHYSKLPTGTFSVLTDKNDCQVGGFYPGAMSDASGLTVKKFKDQDILFVISAHDPKQMTLQAKECQKYRKRMMYDVGPQVLSLSGEDLKSGLAAAEFLIVNDYEMGMLVKKTGMSQEEIKRNVKVCVVTLGKNGALLYDKSKNWREQKVEAVKIAKTVDPTGAGDAFRAGFLYGIVREWDMLKAIKLGSVLASFAIEKHGTQEHSCSWQNINNRYLETYKEAILQTS